MLDQLMLTVGRCKLRLSKTQENMLSNFNFEFPTENQIHKWVQNILTCGIPTKSFAADRLRNTDLSRI